VVAEAIAAARAGQVSVVHGDNNRRSVWMFRHFLERYLREKVSRGRVPPRPR